MLPPIKQLEIPFHLFFFSLQDLLNSEHVTKGNRPQVFPVWQISYLTITQSTEGPDIDAKMFKSN